MDGKNVAIIGAGITGLLTALSLKQREPNADIQIYEAGNGYTTTRHQIIWKTGIKSLLDLGLGKRLSRIATPIHNISAFDLLNHQIFLEKPSQNESSQPLDSTIPPAICVREIDLIRMLLTALQGRDDLVKSNVYSFELPNNGPNVLDPVSGIEGDLAIGNWFIDEGHGKALPFIHYRYELNSLRLSATYGTVSFCCTNNFGTKCTILIGIQSFNISM
jgi:hypothetical protein